MTDPPGRYSAEVNSWQDHAAAPPIARDPTARQRSLPQGRSWMVKPMLLTAVTAVAFGASTAIAAIRSPAARPLVLPADQWLATGLVDQVHGNAGVQVSESRVRAWYFKMVCPEHARCEEEFIRQLSSGGADSTTVHDTPGRATATFSPTNVTCGSAPHARPAREYDTYTFTVPPHDGELPAREQATVTGCGGPPASYSIGWTADLVRWPAFPRATADPQHAATMIAFRQSALSVCRTVNTELAPLAAAIDRDEAVLSKSRGRDIASANAAASIAKLYPKIIPIEIKDYTDVPQPPDEGLGALWVVYGDLVRRQLPYATSEVAALAKAFTAISDYERTGSATDQQKGAAEYSIASSDANTVESLSPTITHLLQLLQVSTECSSPPALTTNGAG